MRAMWMSGFALVFAACQPAKPAASDEKLDPFVVMVDTERHGVLIDKSMEAVREAAPLDDPLLENDVLRADRATKDGVAALLALRNEICGRGLLKGADCKIDLPAWATEPPSADTPLATVDQRSQWLGEAMGKFVDVGCELGRKSDPMFCSVE